jgi:hypothetical protein
MLRSDFRLIPLKSDPAARIWTVALAVRAVLLNVALVRERLMALRAMKHLLIFLSFIRSPFQTRRAAAGASRIGNRRRGRRASRSVLILRFVRSSEGDIKQCLSYHHRGEYFS